MEEECEMLLTAIPANKIKTWDCSSRVISRAVNSCCLQRKQFLFSQLMLGGFAQEPPWIICADNYN